MSVEHTPEAQASGAPPSPKDESPRRFPFVAVIVGVAALALALYVATQVIGVLYGIIAPPAPPLPSDVQQTSYTNRAHGVDTWSYSVPMEACAVARYYVVGRDLRIRADAVYGGRDRSDAVQRVRNWHCALYGRDEVFDFHDGVYDCHQPFDGRPDDLPDRG